MKSYLNGHVRQWHEAAMAGLPFTGSAYRSPDGEVVWIDPPALGADEAGILELGAPSHILVTFRDHDRSVKAHAERFGAQVWVPLGQGGEVSPVHHTYDETTALPAGLKAIGLPAMGYGEHALWAEAYGQRFAFIGDAVFNLDGTAVPWLVKRLFFKGRGGPLRMKRSYRGGNTQQAPEQLRKLLALELDALFLSHGEAVPEQADGQLRQVLGSA